MKLNSYTRFKVGGFSRLLLSIGVASLSFIGLHSPASGQSFDPSPYCDINDSDCNNSFDPEISSVTLGDFTNTSSCGTQDGVSYYENLGPISLCAGGQITGTVKTPGADYNDHALSIWIDFDQDGTFSSSERVYSDLVNVPSSTEVGTHNVSFQIPSSAKKGVTRMRIEVAEDDRIPADEPCEASYFTEDGEIEDYKVDIGPDQSQPDIQVNKIIKPAQGRNNYGIEPVEVEIENRSSQTVSANTTIPFEVNSTLKKRPETNQIAIDQPLSACETRTIVVDTVGLKCDKGGLDLSVVADYGPDVNPANDTAKANYPVKPIDLNFASGEFPSDWSRDAEDQVAVIDDCSNSGGHSLFLDGVTGTTVTSPVFDLSNSPSVTLSYVFREAEDCSGEDPEGNEGIVFEYYDGNTWQEVGRTDGGNQVRSFTENQVVIDQGLTDQFQLRIRVYNGTGNDFDSWLVDDIQLLDPRKATRSPRLNTLLSGPDTLYANSPVYEFKSFSGTGANEWSLDGAITERKRNSIMVEYADTGRDTVQLVSAGCFGLDTAQKVIDVVEPQQAPIAEFYADKNYADTNEVVKLRDISEIGPNQWQYKIEPEFRSGDTAFEVVNGDLGSRDVNVKFSQPGKYSVSLEVANRVGQSRILKTDYIVVAEGYKMCADSNYTTNASGFVYDEGGPDANYPDNQRQTCQLLIEPPCTDSIELLMEKLDLASTNCNANLNPDFVKVYDGRSTSGKALHAEAGYPDGFTNGNAPNGRFSLTAESGAMLVVYSKNGCGDAASGFKARWNAYQSPDSNALMQVRGNQIMGPDTIFAKGSPTYTLTDSLKGASYNWQFPDNDFAVTSTGILNDVFDATPGNKVVRGVTNYCGVTDTATKNVFTKPITQKPMADFTASSTSATINDTIQLLDRTDNGVTEWKWEFTSPSVVEYVNGTGPNTANPYVTFTNSGQYRVDLVATNSKGQDVEAKINYIAVEQPCIPAVNDKNTDLAINEFRIADINGNPIYTNTSKYSSGGFGQYQPMPAVELEGGQAYIMTVRRNSSFNNVDVGVWLDLNGDLSYSKNERISAGRNLSGPQYIDTVRLPNNFNGPLETGLRVATNFGGNGLDGCGPHEGGEFEQYEVMLFNDRTKPVITLKGDDTLNVDPCGANPDTGATAFDGVDGNITNRIRIENLDQLGVEGTHTLTYQVSDGQGNTAQKEQVIEVKADTSSPEVTLKGNSFVRHALSQDYRDAGYNAQDACDNLDTVVRTGGVDENRIGIYQVGYTAIDKQGNESQVQRTVRVFDPVGPTAELKGQDTVRIPVNSEFRDPGVQATDNYRDSAIVSVSGSVNTQEIGNYTLTYNVKDLDTNQVQLQRVVIVEDNVAPSITNIPSGPVIQDVNTSLELPFRVSDNYYDRSDLDVERKGSYFSTFPDGFPDSLGFYKAQFLYTDGSGNTDSVTAAVKVVDRDAPKIELLTSELVNIGRWKTYKDSLGMTYKVSDNYYSTEQLNIERTGSYFDDYLRADSTYPTGLYEIRYKAEDPSNNESSVKVRGVQVDGNTGLSQDGSKGSVEVYPNPTDGQVQVEISDLEDGPVAISVINAKGQKVRSLNTQVNNTGDVYSLDLSQEAKGLYQVKVQTSENVLMESVIVQ